MIFTFINRAIYIPSRAISKTTLYFNQYAGANPHTGEILEKMFRIRPLLKCSLLKKFRHDLITKVLKANIDLMLKDAIVQAAMDLGLFIYYGLLTLFTFRDTEAEVYLY